MTTFSSPSDYTAIDVNYTAGRGFYTTASDVASLLQIADFDANTTPTLAEVGKIIKRVEQAINCKNCNEIVLIVDNTLIEEHLANTL